jgi:hypothetical protein
MGRPGRGAGSRWWPRRRRVASRLRDGDGGWDGVVAVGNGAQAGDQFEVAGKARLREACVALSPVVVGQVVDPLAGHPAGAHP